MSQPKIFKWNEATKVTEIKNSSNKKLRQNAFKINNGGMTRNQLTSELEKMLHEQWRSGHRGQYKLTVLYKNAGFRSTRDAIKMSRDNIIVNIDDTSDSNIPEEEAGKIIGFYLYDFI
jgi:hypothetical protein